MTIKEKQKAIDALKISVPVMGITQEEFNDYHQTLNKIKDWLEQESKTETVTEFADRCMECGARYGKLLRKWIPVSERLPEESDYCLCCDKDGYMTIGCISKWSKNWLFDNKFNINVVAWMPLPEPYVALESEDKE